MLSVIFPVRSRFPSRPREGGFTLLEIAIVTLISAILFAAALPLYTHYVNEKAREKTSDSVATVSRSLSDFISKYSRLPCPAYPASDRGTNTYGHEQCAATPTVDGACDNGLCAGTSLRTIGGTSPIILVGSVPFRELGIPEKYAYDGYGMRLTYAVTRGLTSDSTYKLNEGGITVLDDNGADVGGAANSIPFLVLSHGPDKRGAYGREGAISFPCTGNGQDLENCNTTYARFRMSTYGETGGGNHFDDSVVVANTSLLPQWKVTEAANQDVQSLADNEIGIGMAGSDIPRGAGGVPVAALHVGRAGDGRGTAVTQDIYVGGKICDASGANCFTPEHLAGNHPDMQCPNRFSSGIYVSEISSKAAQDTVTGTWQSVLHATCTDNVGSACASGEFVKGINNDGTFVCAKLAEKLCIYNKQFVAAPCGEGNTPPCVWDNVKMKCLDVSVGTGWRITSKLTKDAYYDYTCKDDETTEDPNDAIWVRTKDHTEGFCPAECDATTDLSMTLTCDWMDGSGAGDKTLTGNGVSTVGRKNCDKTSLSYGEITEKANAQRDYTGCTCDSGKTRNTKVQGCPNGYGSADGNSGLYKKEKVVCDADNPNKSGTWAEDTQVPRWLSGCTCTPSTTSKLVTCSDYYGDSSRMGYVLQTAWVKCDAATGKTSGTCIDDGTRDECAGGASAGSFQGTTLGCSCESSSRTRSVSCSEYDPAKPDGLVILTEEFDCAHADLGWQLVGTPDTSACAPSGYRWVPPNDSGFQMTGEKRGVLVGSSCSLEDFVAERHSDCYRSASGGSFEQALNHNLCKCQKN